MKCSVHIPPGFEGAPIFLDGSISGIMTRGVRGLRRKHGSEGLGITFEMLKNLQKWCKELEGIPFSPDLSNIC